MRRLIWLAVGLAAALAVTLSACGDDDPQPLQQEQTQQQSATAAERSTESGAAAEADEADAAQPQDEESAAATPLEQARAALRAWGEQTERMTIETAVSFGEGGLFGDVEIQIALQLEPLIVLTSFDFFGLFSGMLGSDPDDAAESMLMRALVTETATYVTFEGLNGWIDATEDSQAPLGDVSEIVGLDPTDLLDPDELGQVINCAELTGGDAVAGRHEGEDVWVIECAPDLDALDPEVAAALAGQGIELTEDIESLTVRLIVSRDSGAPLLMESHSTLRGGGLLNGAGDDELIESSARVVLISWNEPIEFPTPEPLIDPAEAEALFGSLFGFEEAFPTNGSAESPGSDELLSADELIARATEWANAVDELHLQFEARAVIDGESRRAGTEVRSSRLQGAFETQVVIDDSSVFRLLWNRDGIWTSAVEAAGEPVWEPSSPSLLGFSGLTVEEFLANPDRINLQPYAELLALSWLTRTIEGGGPAVYELVIESGPRMPGEDYFDAIANLLRAETAELLAEGVTIDSIEYFSTVITIIGEDGRIASQVTTAEFDTNAGRVELVASLSSVTDGPIAFSSVSD